MVRVVMKAKGNLNVWADYETKTQVYCTNEELIHLFMIKGNMFVKKFGASLSVEHLDDFVETYHRLNDFHFDFTDKGIVYYTTKKN